jgi:hypothetical protein
MEHVAREMRIVVPAVDEEGQAHVYGKLTVAETQTVEIVREMSAIPYRPGEASGITAAALSERLNIPVSAASTRLKHLFDRHLIRREERMRSLGGREYCYWPLLRQ